MSKIPKEEYKKNNWISPDELSLNFYFDGGTIGIKCLLVLNVLECIRVNISLRTVSMVIL
jgi:hypothetical protein